MLTRPDFLESKVIIAFPYKGDKITFKNDNLVILDEKGKIKFQYSCYKIFIIYIVGGFSITTGIIERSKRFGFSLVLLTTNFKVFETINYKLEGNTLLRYKQYTTLQSNEISKNIIINKIENQREILNKLRDNKDLEIKNELNVYINDLKDNDYTDQQIMGIEGIASKVYFNRIFKELDWKGRQPRVKKDITNLLLDIGYTILFNYIEAILNIYGFDIYKGNLHKEFYKRKSLVCDMIEPFRPIIDYKIRKMYNLKQFDKTDFILIKGQYMLKNEKSQDIVLELLTVILEYKDCIFIYIQNYYRWFMKGDPLENMPKVRLENNDIN